MPGSGDRHRSGQCPDSKEQLYEPKQTVCITL